MMDKWGAELEDGIEADDLVGIAATEPESNGSIAVSVDKDFKAIPCKLYNPDKPEDGVVEVSEEEANRHHFFQTLVGDSSDNYKGCPSIGPVKANKLLDGCESEEEVWEMILNNFDKAGLSSKHALVQARVSRILRHGDYDFETKKVRLWQPLKQK
jgi:DNA polymerase-1